MAIKHKTHIDTVLAFREQYLQDVGCQETLQQFMQYAGKVMYNVKSDIYLYMYIHIHIIIIPINDKHFLSLMGLPNLECNWISITVCTMYYDSMIVC